MFELIKRIRKVKGAGYSEIMLVLSLISMISVASFKTFGNTAQHQVSGLSYELSGQTYHGRSDGERDSESESATTNTGSSANAQSQPNSSTAGLASSSSNSSTSTDTTSQSANDRVLTPVAEPNSSDTNAADTSTTTQESTTTANQSSSNTSGATQVGTSNQEETLIETLARNVTEFSSGFATGLKQQGTDLLNMFLHPVQTVQDMAALVTMLKDDPKQVLTAMLEELGEDAKKLLSGDARNIGEVAGKYFTPAMITKVVTKLKALGKAVNKASTKDIDRTPSCCCFAKGTPVSTPEGFKAIDQLRIGDLVQSKNEFTGEMQSKPVSNLFLTKGKQLYALTTLNSNGLQETVEVTDNHPYWVEGEWIESAKLKQGMVLTDEAGQKVEVVELQKLGKTEDTYNIEVADFHTYFVGESKVLVHNECSCKLNESPALKDSDYNPDVVDERSKANQQEYDEIEAEERAKDPNFGRYPSLEYDPATKSWKSKEGLVYGQGSKHGNRVEHVLAHTKPDPKKPIHSVFNVDKDKVLDLVDQAWSKRKNKVPGEPGAFIISMKKVIGANGERRIKIVVEPGTDKVITAYPVI